MLPVLAKTMLRHSIARSVGCTFKRIQCTPDLLPTDVTGASIYNQKKGEFEFRAALSLLKLFLPTKSTVLLHELNQLCSKRWLKGV